MIKVTTVSDRHWPAADGKPRIRGSFTRAGGKGKEAGIEVLMRLARWGIDITHSRSTLGRIFAGWMGSRGKRKAESRMLPNLAKPAAKRGRCQIRDRSVTYRRRRKEKRNKYLGLVSGG